MSEDARKLENEPMRVAEEVVGMVKNIDSKLDGHVKEQNEHNRRQAEHNARQLVAEERIAKAIEAGAENQLMLREVMKTISDIQLNIASSLATKSELRNVYKKHDEVKDIALAAKNETASNTQFRKDWDRLKWRVMPFIAGLALLGAAVSLVNFSSNVKFTRLVEVNGK